MKKNKDKIQADSHAQKIFEKRNKAFRILYDTVLEIEGLTDEEIFYILNDNLRKISGVSQLALTTYNYKDSTLNLKAICTDKHKSQRYNILENNKISNSIPPKFLKLCLNKSIFPCKTEQFWFSDFFPSCIFTGLNWSKSDNCYTFSCRREEQLIAVCFAKLDPSKSLRVKDLINTYLNMMGIVIQRINAVHSLQLNEERFRSLYENSTIGIYRVNPSGELMMANPALVDMLGFSDLEELQSSQKENRIFNIFNNRKGFEHYLKNEEKIVGLENRWITKDNEPIYVRESITAIKDERNKIVYYDGTVEDITDKHKAEESLKKANIENKLLINSLYDILIGVDENNQVTHWNPVAADNLNLTKREAIGKNIFSLPIGWDENILKKKIQLCRNQSKPIIVNDILISNDKGKDKILELKISSFSHISSDKSGFIILGEDVTEKKLMEMKVRQTQKLESLGQMAAGIAHEINQPLTYINTILQLILEDIDKDDFSVVSTRKVLKESTNQINKIKKIIDHLRTFSRAETTEKVDSDLKQIVENSIMIIRKRIDKHNIKLKTNFDMNLPRIQANPIQLEQVLINLLQNSIDALENENDPQIVINLSRDIEKQMVKIEVCDNGKGISEENIENVFEPFFTTKEEGHGTGLGLSIIYSIIKDHEGDISCETLKKGGTKFSINLPEEFKNA